MDATVCVLAVYLCMCVCEAALHRSRWFKQMDVSWSISLQRPSQRTTRTLAASVHAPPVPLIWGGEWCECPCILFQTCWWHLQTARNALPGATWIMKLLSSLCRPPTAVRDQPARLPWLADGWHQPGGCRGPPSPSSAGDPQGDG